MEKLAFTLVPNVAHESFAYGRNDGNHTVAAGKRNVILVQW